MQWSYRNICAKIAVFLKPHLLGLMSIINKIAAKMVGSRNERLVKKLSKIVAQINIFEPDLQALSDEALRAKTQDFQQQLNSKQA